MNRLKTVTIAALTAGCVCLPAQADLPQPLVHFAMDSLSDGKVANSGTASGADLTVGSGCSLTNRSVSGSSLFFSGIPDEDTSATFNCPAMKSRTVAFWMYRENAVSQGQVANPTVLPWLVGGASTLNMRLEESKPEPLGNEVFIPYIGTGRGTYLYGCGAARRGSWVHLALTIDVLSETAVTGSATEYVFDWKVYANGELSAKGASVAATNISATGLCRLGNVTDGSRPFYGSIDDFRIYGEALSADQIGELFDSGASGVTTAKLIGRWTFDEWTLNDEDGLYYTPDLSGYGTDMKVSSLTVRTNGVDGGGLHFTGKVGSYAYVKMPTEANSSTWSFWMRQSPDSENIKNGTDKNSPRLLHLAVSRFELIMDTSFTSRRFVYQLQKSSPVSRALSSSSVVHQGTWQHVTFVNREEYDEESDTYSITPELWINGVFVGKGAKETTDVPKLAKNEVLIGSTGYESANAFEGEIDDFRIYAGALSSNQIVRIYRGAAKVSAPDDFTVSGDSCVLCGAVEGFSAGDYRVGYCGKPKWTCVSAPDGAVPGFLRGENLETEVSLPLEGEYVFRLSVNDEFGGESSDVVTVVRNDASGTPASPAPDPSPAISAALSDAEAGASLDEGLIRHWSGTGRTPEKDLKTSGKSLPIGWRDYSLNRLASGDGIAPYAFDLGDVTRGLDAGGTIESVDISGGNSQWPAEEWRTFSLWMYQDSKKDYPHYAPCIISARTTLWVNLNRYDNPKTDGRQQDAGISIIQSGGTYDVAGATQSKFWYKAPFSFTNRWTHLTVAINRHDSSMIELYLDGVKRVPDISDIGKINGVYTGGRVQGNIHFGGINYDVKDYSVQSNSLFSVAHDPATDTFYSRTFPGKLADIRVYNRQLTAAEVAYLARHPGIGFNTAPAVGKAAVGGGVTKKRPSSVSAEAADDGTGTLTYEWVVVKGDASHVKFADRNAKSTTVTVKAAGDFAFALKVSDGERVTTGEPVTVSVSVPGTVVSIR